MERHRAYADSIVPFAPYAASKYAATTVGGA